MQRALTTVVAMPLYRPTELTHFLQGMNREAKRTLSQNFLIDGNVVRQIVNAVEIPYTGTIVEIGSGPGVLTEALLEKGYSVIAIEKDTDFAQALPRLDESRTKLQTVQADALDLSLSQYDLIADRTAIVSNLPYHITTPLLHWMSSQRSLFCQAVLMMQKEVALKLIHDQASYTQFEMRLFFDIAEVCRVSKHCFTPSPKVDSIVLSFTTKKLPLLSEEQIDGLLCLVHSCYMHRRKTIVSTLSQYYDRTILCSCLEQIGRSEQSRPEELHIDDWIALFTQLPQGVFPESFQY